MLSACVAAAAFVAPATQRTTPLAASNDFENPNPILKQALDAVPTIQEGRTMVLVAASEEAAPPPADEQRRRRAQAAEKLQNIDGAERQRRLQAGRVLAVVTLAQSAYLCASHAGPITRLSLLPFLFLSLGLYESAREGL